MEIEKVKTNMPNPIHNLPPPSDRNLAIHVKPAAERALRAGHPWLFDQSITKKSHRGKPGDLAVVFDSRDRFLAVGLYDPHSSIRVRLLQHRKPAPINRDWFEEKLTAAARQRAPLLGHPPKKATTGYRLVHGANDRFPGLVIDRYADTAVLKLYTAAWIPHLKALIAALESATPVERLVLRLGQSMLEHPQALHGLRDGMLLFGPKVEEAIIFRENGLRFEVDPIHGQKTGFFLDQRHNRAQVEELATGKSVLNAFSYTGGFSVYAARGGAWRIVDLDASQPALEAAARNLALNQTIPTVAAATYESVQGDAFEALEAMGENNQRFDIVIVDPPSFAKKKTQIKGALSAYAQLTRLALDVLVPDGTLVQASCSSRVDAETFFDTVNQAAARDGRPLREIKRTGHALDHPITFKESAYLKCLFAVAP
ncbi:MAG: Ribosomal RNA large subunit methyltransferase I [Chloroflexi bacterium]|nr:Ribosomal RNA large subunit methyltransferase I [Chloroflexota bacterium]